MALDVRQILCCVNPPYELPINCFLLVIFDNWLCTEHYFGFWLDLLISKHEGQTTILWMAQSGGPGSQ